MKEKETYTSPLCEAFEIRLEGVIAASGPQPTYSTPFGGEQEWN